MAFKDKEIKEAYDKDKDGPASTISPLAKLLIPFREKRRFNEYRFFSRKPRSVKSPKPGENAKYCKQWRERQSPEELRVRRKQWRQRYYEKHSARISRLRKARRKKRTKEQLKRHRELARLRRLKPNNRARDLFRKKVYRIKLKEKGRIRPHKKYRKELKHAAYLRARQRNPLMPYIKIWKEELKKWHPNMRQARLTLGAARARLRENHPLNHPEAWQSLIEALKQAAILPT